ncbi:DUF952 domain-containing protein [Flectobacillus roseus]|uniref:DUF952 domain-containing protein n=1 Tax=Flectobacillus roseus TaxID=502259 RepID=UPI0024B68962|nr:DUF952 domain-containing protein [Flectobacillus roseus]MDI9871771.1 DUF952 domain-containing protein [Flectobacillus roseus]
MLLHHIVTPEWWAKFEGLSHYESETLAQETFIHFSTPEQVEGTLNRFFVGFPRLILLHINQDLLEAELKFESAGDHGVFPHLYGKLNMSAVTQVEVIQPDIDGIWKR